MHKQEEKQKSVIEPDNTRTDDDCNSKNRYTGPVFILEIIYMRRCLSQTSTGQLVRCDLSAAAPPPPHRAGQKENS